MPFSLATRPLSTVWTVGQASRPASPIDQGRPGGPPHLDTPALRIFLPGITLEWCRACGYARIRLEQGECVDSLELRKTTVETLSILDPSVHFPARRVQPLVAVTLAGLLAAAAAWGQAQTSAPSASGLVFTMTREQMIKYTAKNPYERFPDGRPRVPDALLEKFQDMSSEEIGVSRSGFPNQFVDGL